MPITNIGLPTSFVPTSITGCSLWMDGADPAGTGTPPATGATVTTWIDKSSNTSSTPTFSGTATYNNGVVFSSSSVSGTFISAPANAIYTSFTVMSAVTSTNGVFTLRNPGNNDEIRACCIIGGTNAFETANAPGGSWATILYNSTTFPLTNAIATSSNTATSIGITINGNTASSNVSGTGYTLSTCSNWSIGWNTATVSEIILYNSILSVDQRQQVEKYLAWKWKVPSKLPTTHIGYKGAPVAFSLTPFPGIVFNHTGALQTYTVPSGVTAINLRMWGGAGGGSGTVNARGGAGAYINGNLTVTPGQSLKVIVGGGGAAGAAGGAPGGYGGGGNGDTSYGVGGGGRSAIQTSGGTELVDAGGGGGCGGDALYGGCANYSPTLAIGTNPAGAGAQGLGTGTQSLNGMGGTQTAGGTVSAQAQFGGAAVQGSYLQGGASAKYGGAGGGGYYGGGGAGVINISAAAGGGGSSYTTNALFTLISGENAPGAPTVLSGAPGTSDPYYKAGISVGGYNAIGGHGLVVITPVYPKVSLTALNIVNLGSYTKGSTVIRSTTGQYYTITVPGGAKYMLITMWGAAGAGRGGESGGQGNGAYISGVLKITAGAQYRAIVGKGGSFNHDAADYPYYGGGGVGDWSLYGPGGDGGGRSAIQMLSNSTWVDVATAGGGGGSAGDGNTGEYGRAGAASAFGAGWQGGPHYAGGSNAVKTTSRNGTGGSGGGGGTSSGGEAGLYGASTYATAGSLSQGGNAGYAGGAGGGGYYGGGGGVGDGNVAGAGGGGSSYTALLANLVGYDGTDSNISTPTLYVSGHGVTTGGGGDSLDGIVYYTFYS